MSSSDESSTIRRALLRLGFWPLVAAAELLGRPVEGPAEDPAEDPAEVPAEGRAEGRAEPLGRPALFFPVAPDVPVAALAKV